MAALPRRRRLFGLFPERQDFHYSGRLAFATNLPLEQGFPGSRLFTDAAGTSALVARAELRARSLATADVVLPGPMRTSTQFRLRSFYLIGRTASFRPATMTAHQRVDEAVPGRLSAGARLVAQIEGTTPLVVPRVRDQGAARLRVSGGPVVVDWVVEDALDGAPIGSAEAIDAAAELVEGLAAMWARSGIDHIPLSAADRDRALEAFDGLVAEASPQTWPDSVDRDRLVKLVHRVLADPLALTVGLSHGDPGLGNTLRLADGRLALIDWEDAARRPVGHDMVKVLLSSPLAVGDLLLDPPAAFVPALAGGAPWRRQLAVTLLLFMSGWRHRLARARKRNSVKAHTNRMRRMLELLDRLLDA